MQDGLYVIAGETFDGPEAVAGFRLFKKIKKNFKKIANKALKVATPALGIASIAMPVLAPAAAASAIASRLTRAAKQGHRPARAAMRMFASSADRGDPDAQRFLGVLQRVSQAAPQSLLNVAQLRELAARARRGNTKARCVLQHVAGLAEQGDPAAQTLLEQAAGTTRWDLVAGHTDLAVMGGCMPPPAAGAAEIIAGGPVWDHFKPQRGFRTSQEVLSPRDAYRLGIEAAPPR
jgi:hypothetical protein